MGAQLSTMKNDKLKPKSMSQILDYISTYYILTMDFTSLRKLYDKSYCDNLVVLTSDIVERYFTSMEITYLAQRIQNGVEVNILEKDNMIFFNKDDLSNMNIQNSIKKKRICDSIAKFYIKIAHLFAAIVTTINPIYVYKDAEGNTVQANLKEKGKIPQNTPRNIYKLNICDNRINTLLNKEDYSNIFNLSTNSSFNIHPTACSANINDSGNTKTLAEEPGIPELMELYLDDNYDFATGKFTNMSAQTRTMFQTNLKNFYDVFTGNDPNNAMPPEITKFSDIKLKSYQNTDKCNGPDPTLRRKVTGTLSDKLFYDYATNLKQMITTANTNQSKLIIILNDIFVYTIDPQTNKKKIRINPELTETKLQEIVLNARSLIIKLYLKCESDYATGIKLYEAIVDAQILQSATKQVENLKKKSYELLTEPTMPPPPAEAVFIKNNQQQNIDIQKESIAKQLKNVQREEILIHTNN
jgi:hypothetical protein